MSLDTLSPNSKKIQKPSQQNSQKKASQSLSRSPNPQKKKKTYDKETKRRVLLGLQYALLPELGSEREDNKEINKDKLLSVINEIIVKNNKGYTEILSEILKLDVI